MAIISSDKKRPKYFDRQQLRAEDLTLEQVYQTARHKQLSRHLHGWGVVCGALLTTTAEDAPFEGERLTLGEGFAITPAGDALHIPEVPAFPILQAVRGAPCLGGSGNCEDAITGMPTVTPTLTPTPTPIREPRTVYLIARPKKIPSDPKTGLPEGCAHPGNQLEYSRECDAVCLDVICDLPPLHQQPLVNCSTLRQLFCPETRTGSYPALLNSLFSCPPEVSPEHNYVVLAALNVGWIQTPSYPQSQLAVLNIDYTVRRLLVPTQTLQHYLSCLCGPAPTSTPTPTPTRTPTPTPTFTFSPQPTFVFTPQPTFVFTPQPTFIFTREPTFDFTVMPSGILGDPLGPLTISGIDLSGGLDVRVFDPVRGTQTSIDILTGVRDEYNEPLHGMNIHSAMDLYAADTVAVAERLGISEVQVAELKETALNSMARAQPINLSTNEFNVSLGMSMPVSEIADVGRVRGETLRSSGLASLADVANAAAPQLAGVLGITERQAGAMIDNARNRIRRT